jgi:hypothetical protein
MPILRTRIALNLPETPKGVLYFAKSVAAALGKKSGFTPTRPSLAGFNAHIAVFEKAEAAVLARTAGNAKKRDAACFVVRGDLQLLARQVETASDGPAVDAVAFIETCGFTVAKVGTKNTPELRVLRDRGGGRVELAAKSQGRNAHYHWQYSLDGKRWIDATPTTRCRTTLTGLTVGTRYFFRFRCRTPKGLGDFSQVISHIVG